MEVGFVSIYRSFKKFILISLSDFKDSFRYLTSSAPSSTKGPHHQWHLGNSDCSTWARSSEMQQGAAKEQALHVCCKLFLTPGGREQAALLHLQLTCPGFTSG